MSSFKAIKVNERVFQEIKNAIKKDATDMWIREAYGIGNTTLRLVKSCPTFAAYKRYHAERLARRKAKIAAQLQEQLPQIELVANENDQLRSVIVTCVVVVFLLIAYLMIKELISR